MTEPFIFRGCLELPELLSFTARDERELLEHLEHVPAESIFTHTSGFLLHRAVLPEAYPNDFALWVGTELRDRRLAERLAVVDLFAAGSVEAVRAELVATVEDHLRHLPSVPALVQGEPFTFLESHRIPVPTGQEASTLTEFRDALAEVDASAVFFHLIEARYRLGRERGDFAEWMEHAMGRPDVAERLARVDLSVGSLERLRDRLLSVLNQTLETGAR
ncbi:MAG: DUF5752 family protein [Candidatus Rokubacteria bacterium]|nr:DUF5752 family protein [Candidatus Rokubacteria bacterium]